jgi:hypothetical protein
MPDPVHCSWAASLGALPGRQVRILAWATTPDGYAVASPSALSYCGPMASGWTATDVSARSTVPSTPSTPSTQRDGEAEAVEIVPGEEAWVHLGWHEIERGGWDEETNRLAWSRYADSDAGATSRDIETEGLELTEPGRLPEVFRERVAASIVLEKFVPIRNGRGVLISGRRDLADGQLSIDWHSSLQRGLTWQTEGVRAATDAAIAQVRTEYDMG